MTVCFAVYELKFGLKYLKVVQYHIVGPVELVVQLVVLVNCGGNCGAVVFRCILTIASFGSSGNGSSVKFQNYEILGVLRQFVDQTGVCCVMGHLNVVICCHGSHCSSRNGGC